jgi:hypothetical protein
MREIAKSLVGFSWAVSLFGLQQITKLVAPSTDERASASELDEVSRVVQSHLSGPLAEQFRAGDELQRRVVDVVFDAGSLRAPDPQAVAATLDPRRVAQAIDPRPIVESSVNLLQRSVDVVRRSVQPAPPGSSEAPVKP